MLWILTNIQSTSEIFPSAGKVSSHLFVVNTVFPHPALETLIPSSFAFSGMPYKIMHVAVFESVFFQVAWCPWDLCTNQKSKHSRILTSGPATSNCVYLLNSCTEYSPHHTGEALRLGHRPVATLGPPLPPSLALRLPDNGLKNWPLSGRRDSGSPGPRDISSVSISKLSLGCHLVPLKFLCPCGLGKDNPTSSSSKMKEPMGVSFSPKCAWNSRSAKPWISSWNLLPRCSRSDWAPFPQTLVAQLFPPAVWSLIITHLCLCAFFLHWCLPGSLIPLILNIASNEEPSHLF